MWLMTTFGFFSIVAKPGQAGRGELTLRARARGDLDQLRRRYLPALGPTVAGGGTDYPYRAVAPAADVARAAGQAVADINYGNFKSAVAAAQGSARAHAYHDVWSALHALAEPTVAVAGLPPKPPGRAAAYGGVVFDAAGRVLLRRATGDYGDVRWTFPKGRPNAGETPDAAARREVREEGGVDAVVRDPIRTWYPGQVTWTLYFVMDLVHDHGDADPAETAAVRWVTADVADRLIAESGPTGRARDSAVLAAAHRLGRA